MTKTSIFLRHASPPPKNHHTATKHSSPSPPHSDSGSHLHFHSNSDDEDGDQQHDDFSHSPSPLHLPHKNNGNYYNDSPQQPQYHNILRMNFMKNKPSPASSILYEQRPMTNETVYVGESSSSFYNPYQQQEITQKYKIGEDKAFFLLA